MNERELKLMVKRGLRREEYW